MIRLPFKLHDSDVVFIWFADYHAFITTFFTKIIRKPIMIVTGGYDVAGEKEVYYGLMCHPFFKRMVKYVLKHASKILPVSEFNKREIEKHLKTEKMEVIYNAIDENYFVPGEKKEDIVLTVAVIDNRHRARVKGLDIFIRVSKFLPNVNFLAIGIQGKALKEFQSKKPPNVTLIEYVSQNELLRYYQKAKVYCQLSYYEACGVALEEAMSCECMPVVTNRGALPEVVGDTGLCVNYGEIDGTIDAIRKALNDDKNGNKARRRVIENFSLREREKKLKDAIINTVKTFQYE